MLCRVALRRVKALPVISSLRFSIRRLSTVRFASSTTDNKPPSVPPPYTPDDAKRRGAAKDYLSVAETPELYAYSLSIGLRQSAAQKELWSFIQSHERGIMSSPPDQAQYL